MDEITKFSPVSGEDTGDCPVTPVPEEKRINWSTQGFYWAGTVLCVPMFTIGGALASAMDICSFLAAVFFGTLVIALTGFLSGAIGAKTHLTSGFITRFALGASGGKLFSLILALSLSGWFGYQCHDFAKSIVSTLSMFGFPETSTAAWTVAGGLLMILTATAGFNGIALLSSLGTPLLIALSLAAAFVTASQTDPSALRAASALAAGRMSLSGGITLVVGGYITGACITSDISRFSRTQKDAFWACFLGRMVAFPLALLLGGFFQYAYGISNPCLVMFSYCDMAVFVPFMLVVSMWAINNCNLYSSVLGVMNTLDGRFHIPQWLITLLVGGISTLLGALGIMDAYLFFLNLLGVLIPPVAAVVLADYYLYARHNGLYRYENASQLKPFRTNTCLSAAVGIAVGLLCNYANIPFLNALCLIFPASVVAMLSSVTVLVLYNTFRPAHAASPN